MLKQVLRFRIVLIMALVMTSLCPVAFASGNDYGRSDRRDNRNNYNGGERHYYRDGRWYKRDQQGHEVSVADIVIGAIAEALPPQHKTIVVQNTQYYYDNSHYYQRRPDNTYIVVDPPRR